jgi:hypothetical protein
MRKSGTILSVDTDTDLPQRRCEDFTLGYVRFEHIAGKYCNDTRGYNGNFITIDEMLGCTTVQCLAPKDQNTKPSKGDNYFLTGLSDLMPERNDGGPRLTPVLHGADTVHVDDIIWPVSFLPIFTAYFMFPHGFLLI